MSSSQCKETLKALTCREARIRLDALKHLCDKESIKLIESTSQFKTADAKAGVLGRGIGSMPRQMATEHKRGVCIKTNHRRNNICH